MMTLKRLEGNLAEMLKSKFHNHPLLLTCQSVFHHFMAEMNQFDYTSEDLFVEAADVIDTIFAETDYATKYIEGLWDNVKIKLKKNVSIIPPQDDLNIVCAVLFYVVATTFRLHWQKYYNTEIVNMLEGIVRKKGQFKDVNEQREVIDNLCIHTESLETWINEYEDSEEWLSDEIEECLRGKKSVIKKDDKKEVGKKKEIIKTSFKYKLNGIDLRTRNVRLEQVFEDMKKEGVELRPINTDKKDFLEIFSGEETMKRIAWIGNANELHYIFSEWIRRNYLLKPKGGIWVVAAARFYHKKKDSDGVWSDEEFSPDELRKAGNPKNPSDDLEQIIEMLKPDERVRRY